MATTENEQRDELALDIFLADNGNIPEGELREDWVDAPGRHRPYAQNIADGLIAKGYRKPRTITTMEGLDALASGTAIRDAEGLLLELDSSAANSTLLEWHFGDRPVAVELPATVLWEPEAEVGA